MNCDKRVEGQRVSTLPSSLEHEICSQPRPACIDGVDLSINLRRKRVNGKSTGAEGENPLLV